jgi:hypothetical protein
MGPQEWGGNSFASRSHGAVDSDRRSGRARLRTPTLETAMQFIADRSAERHPQQSWRNFRLVGTQSLSLADHLVVTGWRREVVEAQRTAGSARCWRAFRDLGRRRWRGLGEHSRSLSFRKRGWSASGFTVCCRMKGSKATSSIRPRFRPRVDAGERRLTESTARCCIVLVTYECGEPRVCAMVKAPTPEEEDRRRLRRERKVLTNERILHDTSTIAAKSLLM